MGKFSLLAIALLIAVLIYYVFHAAFRDDKRERLEALRKARPKPSRPGKSA